MNLLSRPQILWGGFWCQPDLQEQGFYISEHLFRYAADMVGRAVEEAKKLDASAVSSADQLFSVAGMDCASCATTVERAVCALPGVVAAEVELGRSQLTVRFDPVSVTAQSSVHLPAVGLVEQIVRTLAPLGYAAQPMRSAQFGSLQVEQSGHAGHLDSHEHGNAFGLLTRRLGPVFVLVAAAFLVLLVPASSTVIFGFAAAFALWPLAKRAYLAARVGNPFTMHSLVTLATIGAIVIGETAEAALVVGLFVIGEWIEGVAARRARAGLQALVKQMPNTVLLVRDGVVQEVAVSNVSVGELVRVLPGSRVPLDGWITEGTSLLDESAITGESMPRERSVGELVLAGSINGDHLLELRVKTALGDDTMSRIAQLVAQGEANKAPAERTLERFARRYTPLVVLVALLTAVIGPLFGGLFSDWLHRALAVLLIGCPCALVIATPTAVAAGLAAGARRGLLVKGGAAFEAIGRVRTVVFDKTGTLTHGQPSVHEVIALSGSDDELVVLAAAVEQHSNHPLARAITAEAERRGLTIPLATGATSLPGRAAVAVVGGQRFSVGSVRHARQVFAEAGLAEAIEEQILRLEQDGHTVVVVFNEQAVLGIIALRDEPRGEARVAVDALRTQGISSVMLTGDNAWVAQAVAGELGIEARAELLPEDKLRLVGELSARASVAMVGDGINDAPALARADVGIALGTGTDVALETADCALVRPDLAGVPALVHLSRTTLGVIRQNLLLAIGLKAGFLVAALFGLSSLWLAVLVDTGATVLVTANALRIGRSIRPNRGQTNRRGHA